jgi:enoyl-CoA hydratase
MRSSGKGATGGVKVEISAGDGVVTVAIVRPEVRNAVDSETAGALADAFRNFEKDGSLAVAVLTGTRGI